MFSLAGKVETYEKVKGKIPVVSQHNKLFKFVSAVQKLHHILQYHFAVRNKEYKEEGGQISYRKRKNAYRCFATQDSCVCYTKLQLYHFATLCCCWNGIHII